MENLGRDIVIDKKIMEIIIGKRNERKERMVDEEEREMGNDIKRMREKIIGVWKKDYIRKEKRRIEIKRIIRSIVIKKKRKD